MGAFPTAFTNYNFIAIRKLLPDLIADETRGLAGLEADAAELPAGDARTWLERLAGAKRAHLTELKKLAEAPPASSGLQEYAAGTDQPGA